MGIQPNPASYCSGFSPADVPSSLQKRCGPQSGNLLCARFRGEPADRDRSLRACERIATSGCPDCTKPYRVARKFVSKRSAGQRCISVPRSREIEELLRLDFLGSERCWEV